LQDIAKINLDLHYQHEFVWKILQLQVFRNIHKRLYVNNEKKNIYKHNLSKLTLCPHPRLSCLFLLPCHLMT